MRHRRGVRREIIKGNTQIDPKMSKCTESLSRQETLKHKVWLPAKANFIKFTTRRSEATGNSHGGRCSSNAQSTKLLFFCFFFFFFWIAGNSDAGYRDFLSAAVAWPGVISISLFFNVSVTMCCLDYTSK